MTWRGTNLKQSAFFQFGNNHNYMNMAEASNAFFAASEFKFKKVASPGLHQKATVDNTIVKNLNSNEESGATFHTPSLGDEEFEIPPITPPPESDPALGVPDVLLPFQGLGDPLPSQGSEFTPQFPPQSLDLPSITISRNLGEQDGVLHSSGSHMLPFQDQSHTQVSQYRQDPSLIMRSIVHMTDAARSGIMPPAQLTTINQSQLSAQLGLNLGGASLPTHLLPLQRANRPPPPLPAPSTKRMGMTPAG
ncbi:hypothetical protein QTO34_010836 [Cnephaeus nilssonii]|uniref:Uncharacterized protein n=1 Tax=Cnephaeus nilssonii TaxID=3371016 RepID=A0AA40HG64_CNENI|nr:hypothetical protein QTO34_010836 [Eptesicus nilssonii]